MKPTLALLAVIALTGCVSRDANYAPVNLDNPQHKIAPRPELALTTEQRDWLAYNWPKPRKAESLRAPAPDDAPYPVGMEIAPFKITDAWERNYTATLTPGVSSGWELQWSTNLLAWQTLIKVSPPENSLTVTMKANPLYFRAKLP